MATQKPEYVAVAAYAAYTAARLAGLLGVAVVYTDSLVAASTIAVAVASQWRWGRLLGRGTEVALAAGLAPLLLPLAFIPVAGAALNGLVAGHFMVLPVLRLVGVAAAASLAAAAAGRRLGVPAASLAMVAPVLGPAASAPLTPGSLSALGLSAAAGVAVGVVASRYGPLPGLLYGLLGVAAPVYALPLLPRLPPLAVKSILLAGHVVAAVYASEASRGGRDGPRAAGLRPLLAPLAVLAIVVASMKLGYYVAVVATGSMEPVIEPGDLVVIAPASPGSLHRGDIVAYVGYDGSLVVHRLVGFERRGALLLLHTKGDANPAEDRPFPESRLVGKVVAHIPLLGLPQLLAAKMLGSTLALPALLAAAAAAAAAHGGRRAPD